MGKYLYSSGCIRGQGHAIPALQGVGLRGCPWFAQGCQRVVRQCAAKQGNLGAFSGWLQGVPLAAAAAAIRASPVPQGTANMGEQHGTAAYSHSTTLAHLLGPGSTQPQHESATGKSSNSNSSAKTGPYACCGYTCTATSGASMAQGSGRCSNRIPGSADRLPFKQQNRHTQQPPTPMLRTARSAGCRAPYAGSGFCILCIALLCCAVLLWCAHHHPSQQCTAATAG